jgi:hypothetical protein
MPGHPIYMTKVITSHPFPQGTREGGGTLIAVN